MEVCLSDRKNAVVAGAQFHAVACGATNQNQENTPILGKHNITLPLSFMMLKGSETRMMA